MGLSKILKEKIERLSLEEKDELIKMTIEDKTSFLDIENIFGLTPGEVEKFLLKELGTKVFKRWKLRQNKRSTNKDRAVTLNSKSKKLNINDNEETEAPSLNDFFYQGILNLKILNNKVMYPAKKNTMNRNT